VRERKGKAFPHCAAAKPQLAAHSKDQTKIKIENSPKDSVLIIDS
jgi:hypothetical protein